LRRRKANAALNTPSCSKPFSSTTSQVVHDNIRNKVTNVINKTAGVFPRLANMGYLEWYSAVLVAPCMRVYRVIGIIIVALNILLELPA
jgi:hypothetical protein